MSYSALDTQDLSVKNTFEDIFLMSFHFGRKVVNNEQSINQSINQLHGASECNTSLVAQTVKCLSGLPWCIRR